MDDKIDFSAIHRAGLTQSEFADICAVNRITVNLWVKGKMQPHRYNRDHVAMCILATDNAIKARKLPLPSGLKGDRRIAALRSALSLPEKTI